MKWWEKDYNVLTKQITIQITVFIKSSMHSECKIYLQQSVTHSLRNQNETKLRL